MHSLGDFTPSTGKLLELNNAFISVVEFSCILEIQLGFPGVHENQLSIVTALQLFPTPLRHTNLLNLSTIYPGLAPG